MSEFVPLANIGASLTLVIWVIFVPYLGMLQRSLSSRTPPSTRHVVYGLGFCAAASATAIIILPALNTSSFLPSEGLTGAMMRLLISMGLLNFTMASLRLFRSMAIRLDHRFRMRRCGPVWNFNKKSGEPYSDPTPNRIPLQAQLMWWAEFAVRGKVGRQGCWCDSCEECALDREEQRENEERSIEVEQLELLEYLLASSILLGAMSLLSLAFQDLESPLMLILVGLRHPYLRILTLMLPSCQAFTHLCDVAYQYLPIEWRQGYDTPWLSTSKFYWRRGVLPFMLENALPIPCYVLYATVLIAMMLIREKAEADSVTARGDF